MNIIFIKLWTIVGPIIYLIFHGWANKNLLDTELTDKLAKWFFLVSTGILMMLFLWWAN